MNAKHEKFAQAIADGKSLLGAHESAGYKADVRNAAVIKRRTDVQQRVHEILTIRARDHEKIHQRALEVAGFGKGEVYKELGYLGFSDIGEIMTYGEPTAIRNPDTGEWLRTPNGELAVTHNPTLKAMDQLPERVRRAIKKIRFDRWGYPEIELYAKDVALEKLGRELGMFKLAALDAGGSTPEELARAAEAKKMLRDTLEMLAGQWHRPPPAIEAKPNGKGEG